MKAYIDEIQGDKLCISNMPGPSLSKVFFDYLKHLKKYKQLGTFKTKENFKESEQVEIKIENGKIIEVKKLESE